MIQIGAFQDGSVRSHCDPAASQGYQIKWLINFPITLSDGLILNILSSLNAPLSNPACVLWIKRTSCAAPQRISNRSPINKQHSGRRRHKLLCYVSDDCMFVLFEIQSKPSMMESKHTKQRIARSKRNKCPLFFGAGETFFHFHLWIFFSPVASWLQPWHLRCSGIKFEESWPFLACALMNL